MADGFKMDDQAQAPNPPNPSSPNAPSQNPAVTTQQAILGAVEANFVAQRTRAMANLNSYLLSPVGVAEHIDYVSTAEKKLESLSNAQDKLTALNDLDE